MNRSIVAIGDSITYGFPYSHRESWVLISAKRLGIPMLNQGQCGETTAEMRVRFKQDVLVENPTHVIIMGGTNDAFYNIPVELVCHNIYQMCELAVAAQVKPILGLPIPVNEVQIEEWLKKYRQWLRDFAAKMNYQVIDFYTAMVDSETGLIIRECHDDGVHPNITGYQKMAAAVSIED